MSSDRGSRLKRFYPLLLVLGLAAVVRVAYLVAYSQMPDWTQLTVDNWYHHNWAQVIANGNVIGDTTYFRAPLYIWALGLMYAIFGPLLWVGRILGSIIGLASVAGTYLLGCRVFDQRIGVTAALIHAVYPIALYFEPELLLDPLFTLLLQVAVLASLRWWRSPRLWAALTVGLLFGAAALARPLALVPAAVVLAAMAARAAVPPRSRLAAAAMVITGLVVLAGPVYMRNVLLSGDHVLIASQGGVNLYLGNNSIADGISPRLPEPWGANWRLDDMVFEAERDEGRELSPGEVSAWWRNEALGWMVDNPGRAGRLFLHKLYFTIGNREVSNNRDLPRFIRSVPILRLIPLGFATVFAFAALGCWAGWRSAEVRLIAAIVIAMTLVTAVFFFASRFRLPLLPYYFVLAASGALFLLRRLMERPRAAVAPVGLVLLIWLFSYLPMVSLPPGPVVTGLLSKGLSHYHQGNFAEAARWFEAARAADTTYPEASLNLAACRIQQGRADEARSLLRTEIALHPKRAKAYTNLASLELAAGRAASAAAWAEQAIDRRPHDREANRVWLRASEQDSAISDSILLKRVERSAYNTSDHQLVLYEGALLLSERGRYRAALGWLQRATESGPPPIEMDDAAFDPDFANHPARLAHRQGLILYQMGFLSGLTGDVSGAVTYSSRAIAADSGIVGAYINLAGGLAAQSRLDEAERIVRLARQRFPDDSLIQSLGR